VGPQLRRSPSSVPRVLVQSARLRPDRRRAGTVANDRRGRCACRVSSERKHSRRAPRFRPSCGRAARPAEGGLDRAGGLGRGASQPRSRAPVLLGSAQAYYGVRVQIARADRRVVRWRTKVPRRMLALLTFPVHTSKSTMPSLDKSTPGQRAVPQGGWRGGTPPLNAP
jgi:hypothetical protein